MWLKSALHLNTPIFLSHQAPNAQDLVSSWLYVMPCASGHPDYRLRRHIPLISRSTWLKTIFEGGRYYSESSSCQPHVYQETPLDRRVGVGDLNPKKDNTQRSPKSLPDQYLRVPNLFSIILTTYQPCRTTKEWASTRVCLRERRREEQGGFRPINVQVTFASCGTGATGGIVATLRLSTYSICSQTTRNQDTYPHRPVDKCVGFLLVNTNKAQLKRNFTRLLYNLWITHNVN